MCSGRTRKALPVYQIHSQYLTSASPSSEDTHPVVGIDRAGTVQHITWGAGHLAVPKPDLDERVRALDCVPSAAGVVEGRAVARRSGFLDAAPRVVCCIDIAVVPRDAPDRPAVLVQVIVWSDETSNVPRLGTRGWHGAS